MTTAARIIGRAARTGAGVGVDALWHAMEAARALVADQDLGDLRFADLGEPTRFVGTPLDSRRFQSDPARTWLTEVITDALRDAAIDRLPQRTALFTGTSLGGMAAGEQLHRHWWDPDGNAGPAQITGPMPTHSVQTRYDGPTASAASLLSMGGGGWTLNTACSSAANALGIARLWLSARRIDAAVIAGFDVISPFVYSGFGCLHAMDRRASTPFCSGRAGLNLGDAAIAFVMVRDEDGDSPDAPPGEHHVGTAAQNYGRLVGYGSSCDAHHLTRPDLSGAGLARAIDAALGDACTDPSQIAFISAHGTGTPFNDTMEAAAFTRVFGDGTCPPLHCAKPVSGHTLGAAGAVDALVVIESLRRGTLPATFAREPDDPDLRVHPSRKSMPVAPCALALSTSSGFGGSNAALIFEGAQVQP